jgi:hypothetical protein
MGDGGVGVKVGGGVCDLRATTKLARLVHFRRRVGRAQQYLALALRPASAADTVPLGC